MADLFHRIENIYPLWHIAVAKLHLLRASVQV